MSVDHLGPEAVAAFVDGELTSGARQRASNHLAHCLECRREVDAQRAVAVTMREVLKPEHVASDQLIQRLARIPEAVEGTATGGQLLPSKNFAIDGRRFPKTMTDWADLTFHKFRDRSRPSVR